MAPTPSVHYPALCRPEDQASGRFAISNFVAHVKRISLRMSPSDPDLHGAFLKNQGIGGKSQPVVAETH